MFAGKFPVKHLHDVIDMGTVHVDYPSKFIFLCGGRYDATGNKIYSMRGAFREVAYRPPFPDYEIILAEDVSREFQARPDTYDNLLLLESDIAQLSSMILLFSESFGSAAELGAFCWDTDISQRLLVVISDKHNEETSFVKLGPLQYLREKQGKESVCVLPNRLCLAEDLDANKDNCRDDFFWYVKKSFDERIKITSRKKSTFNKTYRGHIILFLIGIVWYYHALEKNELCRIASSCGLELTERDVEQYMFCAVQFEWVALKVFGTREFYVVKCQNKTFNFQRKDLSFDATSWKVEVLSFWTEHDRERVDAIRAVRQSGP